MDGRADAIQGFIRSKRSVDLFNLWNILFTIQIILAGLFAGVGGHIRFHGVQL